MKKNILVLTIVLIIVHILQSLGVFQKQYIYVNSYKFERPKWHKFQYVSKSNNLVEHIKSYLGIENHFSVSNDAFSFIYKNVLSKHKTVVVFQKIDRNQNPMLMLFDKNTTGLEKYIDFGNCIVTFEQDVKEKKDIQIYGTEVDDSINFFITSEKQEIADEILNSICKK